MQYGVFDVLTLCGAIGFFLYGMKVMSDALLQLAGNRMRTILATATANRFLAILTGLLITAAIQSSSATTLMVVSFVNANLLTLFEAIGVIMGANIGTTVTAWLIAILGFKVKISVIALPLVGAGFLMSLSRHAKKQQWGLFLVGFALLFLGLDFLKDAVPDISAHPDMLQFLQQYTQLGYLSLLLFLLIGAILTMVIQSSSATTALVLLMCHQGWLPFDMACVMMLGGNVGTTVTANLAALVANHHAKRAAFAHSLFNILGTLWVLLLFYPFINWIAQLTAHSQGSSPWQDTLAIPIALSLFHTIFNAINTLLFIGFIPYMVKLAEKLIAEDKHKSLTMGQPLYLTQDAQQYPETAIKALTDESIRLLENAAYKIVAHGLWVHRHDLEQKPMHDVLRNSSAFDIDIDSLYSQQIKTVYNQIVNYATQLQSRLDNLSPDHIEQIRNILMADRLLVQVIKRIKPLHQNLSTYLQSDNESIRHEYNLLRKRILKVIRQIKRLRNADDPLQHLTIIRKHRKKAQKLDVLLTGRINTLIQRGISQDMATSLINDSLGAQRITQHLADIAMILYTPKDKVSNALD